MAERKNTHGLRLSTRRGAKVIDIGDMEIWDGADLSLIRDTLHILVRRENKRTVGIEMKHVKYVPSGFFGMLFDWFESGITIKLFGPQSRVQDMLWFKRFVIAEAPGSYRLHDGSLYNGPDLAEEEDEAETEMVIA
jgi:hypothetical protein